MKIEVQRFRGYARPARLLDAWRWWNGDDHDRGVSVRIGPLLVMVTTRRALAEAAA